MAYLHSQIPILYTYYNVAIWFATRIKIRFRIRCTMLKHIVYSLAPFTLHGYASRKFPVNVRDLT